MLLIKTDRLCLKPLDTSFCNSEYLKWLNDNDVLRYLETQKGTTLKELHNIWKILKKTKFTHGQ